MAFYSLNIRTSCFFSLLKNKCRPLQTNTYNSLQHLYQQLSSFEKGLTQLQQKRMPKLLQDFQKRLKRLHKSQHALVPQVRMQLSHTYQFFSRKSDEIIFGPENTYKEISLEQLITITQSMVRYGLNTYLRELTPKVHKNRGLFQAIEQRFTKIQQQLSKIIFKGYSTFANVSSKYTFLQERQYKGDFKFELIEDMNVLEKASQCFYYCSLFNQMRSKITLACQLMVTTKFQQLSDLALSRLIYCLAVAGRPLRLIQKNFLKVCQKLRNHPRELLFYMVMSNIQDAILAKHIFEDLTFKAENFSQQLLNNLLKANLQRKYDVKLKLINIPQFQNSTKQHGGQVFFQDFLKRFQYKYTKSYSENSQYYQLYSIQNKNFLCLDHSLVNREKWSLNGFGLIIRQHFLDQQIPLKHINWPRMLEMERRTEKDQYLLSKFKGIQRPKVVKVRFYD